MPLTDFQRRTLALLAPARTPDSHLGGGAAIHFHPNSTRYSRDLDFFHDSEARVASAFAEDSALLTDAGYSLEVEISQPGFIRATVRRDEHATKIDWAHDSAWRFMPPVEDEVGGFLLHDVDLAINKALALAGRDEPRDYVDILFIHERVLPLPAVVWAAVGKDPGLTPLSLLGLLRRRGRPRPEEIARLDLTSPFDLVRAKETWLSALDAAESFARSRPTEETGCLYYSSKAEGFVQPHEEDDLDAQGLVVHFGSPGGVLPQIAAG
jgi:Nucleotidyl transferase AbiEii toxin, Type IV TA system